MSPGFGSSPFAAAAPGTPARLLARRSRAALPLSPAPPGPQGETRSWTGPPSDPDCTPLSATEPLPSEMSADAAAGAPLPRLCCLEKGPNGYGFHLHGEKGKVGQYIRLVEPGSPAEKSGLLAGDRLVEVNGENVEKETHQQVVNRIRAALNSVRLLVVDPETDERLQKLGVQVREEMLRARDGPGQAAPPAAAGEDRGAGGENEPPSAAPEPREQSHQERVSAGPGLAARLDGNGWEGE